MQIFALGLLGELIIFTHARDMKDYRVDEVRAHYENAARPELGEQRCPRDDRDDGTGCTTTITYPLQARTTRASARCSPRSGDERLRYLEFLRHERVPASPH